jgi:NDP-4-keto-2,6-dideoxyhexose 3-C-methyltransferase
MTDHVTTRSYCRACAVADVKDLPPLVPLLSLGPIALSTFPEPGERPAHPPVPLTLAACPRCTLVQLTHTTPFQWMFGSTQYWYRSGVNETMRAELTDVADTARVLLGGLTAKDHVLDIGANDGTLLAAYGAKGSPGAPYKIACEPSQSLHDALRAHCSELHPAPFPCDTLDIWEGGLAVVTACAMIYDLEDPIRFFAQIERLLTPEGVCLVQFQDLAQMIESTAFDCVCHEHLEYYTLYALATLLNHCGLWVTDVETREINGGSLRVTIRKRGHGASLSGSSRVLSQIAYENRLGLTTIEGLRQAHLGMAARMHAMRAQIRATCWEVVERGGTVDLYGASTKGNTLLQYIGLTEGLVRQAWERSAEKVGRRVGTTGIPIVSEDEGRANPPSVLLVPIWQFRDAVIRRERAYLEGGGTLLFPLPVAEVVRMKQVEAAKDVA